MVQMLELLWLVKRHNWGQSNIINSKEIKPGAIAIIELCLSEKQS